MFYDSNAVTCYHCWVFKSQKKKAMPSLSVRKIDTETLSLLRVQAAKHGVSMEEEVRQIIKKSVSTPENIGDLAVRLFSPAYGVDELKIAPREIHEPLKFQ